jgi:hypothetical protein
LRPPVGSGRKLKDATVAGGLANHAAPPPLRRNRRSDNRIFPFAPERADRGPFVGMDVEIATAAAPFQAGDGGSIPFTPFGQKTHLTALSCGLLMIIAQEPAQSLAALDAPLSIEVTVPRK